jgi:hypothetical protein
MTNQDVKKIYLLLIIISSVVFLQAQSEVTFDYDGAGNRTSRNIIELLPESTQNDSTLKCVEMLDISTITEQNSSSCITETIGQTIVHIYPNPTGGKFTVEIIASSEETTTGLRLLSLMGEQIFIHENPGIRTEINLTGRPAGAYILSITIDRKTRTWKVIKQ